MDQIQEMCENYDVEDEGLFKKELKRKHNSSKKLKYLFISYCLLVSLFLLLPFMTVFVCFYNYNLNYYYHYKIHFKIFIIIYKIYIHIYIY